VTFSPDYGLQSALQETLSPESLGRIEIARAPGTATFLESDDMSVGDEVDNGQAELDALNAVVKALRPLNTESQRLVFDSAIILLGTGSAQRRAEADLPAMDAQAPSTGAVTIRDIRALKEQKVPQSADEMAAVDASIVMGKTRARSH